MRSLVRGLQLIDAALRVYLPVGMKSVGEDVLSPVLWMVLMTVSWVSSAEQALVAAAGVREVSDLAVSRRLGMVATPWLMFLECQHKVESCCL